jgi:hypothetical protein
MMISRQKIVHAVALALAKKLYATMPAGSRQPPMLLPPCETVIQTYKAMIYMSLMMPIIIMKWLFIRRVGICPAALR